MTESCQVCDDILRLAGTVPYEEFELLYLPQDSRLIDTECPHSKWAPHIKKGELVKSSDSRYLDFRFKRDGWHIFPGPLLVALVAKPDKPNHGGTARLVDPEWIDQAIMRDWLLRCSQRHGNSCDEAHIPGLRPICPRWLIDASRGCIVPARHLQYPNGSPPRYFALSYTWGQVKAFRTRRNNIEQLQRPGALLSDSISDQIPRTIRDAMALVRLLSETYLWVDSICIVQDEPEALHDEIQQMHRIYASAFLTILATDGLDADYGLRGLKGTSQPRAVTQHVFEVAYGEVLSSISMAQGKFTPFSQDILDPRNYDMRMWTFQEVMFSRRTLAFRNGAIEWDCSRGGWSEDSIYNTKTEDGNPSQRMVTEPLMVRGKVPNLADLSFLVNAFNVRSVTDISDVFNAFSGVHTSLHHIFPGGLLFGIPEFFFEICLIWCGAMGRTSRRLTPSGMPLDNIPSWSWMAWQGWITFPSDAEHYSGDPGNWAVPCGFTAPLATWIRGVRGDLTECGWTRHDFNPAEEPKPRRPPPAPRETPKYYYTRDEDTRRYWYPTPIVPEGDPSPVQAQHRYLFARVPRVFLTVATIPDPDLEVRLLSVIQDELGHVVGGFDRRDGTVDKAPDDDDDELKPEILPTEPLSHQNPPAFQTAELVGVARGWTTPYKFREDTKKVQEDGESSDDSESTYRWVNCPARDCYFVLWIERGGGDDTCVAQRRLAGFIYADEWERLEKEDIDLVLG